MTRVVRVVVTMHNGDRQEWCCESYSTSLGALILNGAYRADASPMDSCIFVFSWSAVAWFSVSA